MTPTPESLQTASDWFAFWHFFGIKGSPAYPDALKSLAYSLDAVQQPLRAELESWRMLAQRSNERADRNMAEVEALRRKLERTQPNLDALAQDGDRWQERAEKAEREVAALQNERERLREALGCLVEAAESLVERLQEKEPHEVDYDAVVRFVKVARAALAPLEGSSEWDAQIARNELSRRGRKSVFPWEKEPETGSREPE